MSAINDANIVLPSASDFTRIKELIAEMHLDDRNLKPEEFILIKNQNAILAFGRRREYKNFNELCSLGVIASQRNKGLGKKICQHLIQKSKKTSYLVCIIPAYFESLGFTICHEYPPEINDKLTYCFSALAVEQPYVVMKREVSGA